jgi:hypothetical protein
MDVEGNFLDGRSKAGCVCVIPCPQAATSLHDEPRRNESACGKPAMVLDVVNVVKTVRRCFGGTSVPQVPVEVSPGQSVSS